MEALSIRLKGVLSESKDAGFSIEHDFRLFGSGPKPDYINYEKTNENFLLYARDDIPKSYKDIKNFLAKVDEENRLIFLKLKEKNMIKRNQGYKIKSPTLHGILTLSKEAQQSITNLNMREVFFSKAKEYLLKLANQLGTDLLYAIVHLDETAPHIHFCMRNIRYKISTSDEYFQFNTDKKAIGKSLTNSFCVRGKWQQREHMIELTKIQDSLMFFHSIGFSRGIPKTERLKQGATRYEVIHRTVKELHETLPADLEKKKQETLAKYKEWKQKYIEEYRKLEKEKEELKKSINEYQNQLLLLNEEIKKKQELIRDAEQKIANAEAIAQQKITKAERIVEQKLKEINEAIAKTNEMIQNAIDKANQEINEVNQQVEKKTKEIEDRKRELGNINKMIEERNKELAQKNHEIQNLSLEITSKRKELQGITQQLQGITQQIAHKTKELQRITEELRKKETMIQEYQDIDNKIQKKKEEYQELYWKVKTLIFEHNLTIDTVIKIKEKAEQMTQEQQMKNHKWDMDI